MSFPSYPQSTDEALSEGACGQRPTALVVSSCPLGIEYGLLTFSSFSVMKGSLLTHQISAACYHESLAKTNQYRVYVKWCLQA